MTTFMSEMREKGRAFADVLKEASLKNLQAK